MTVDEANMTTRIQSIITPKGRRFEGREDMVPVAGVLGNFTHEPMIVWGKLGLRTYDSQHPVTHTPTGRLVIRLSSREKALSFIRRALDINWDFPNPDNVPRWKRRAIQALIRRCEKEK